MRIPSTPEKDVVKFINECCRDARVKCKRRLGGPPYDSDRDTAGDTTMDNTATTTDHVDSVELSDMSISTAPFNHGSVSGEYKSNSPRSPIPPPPPHVPHMDSQGGNGHVYQPNDTQHQYN